MLGKLIAFLWQTASPLKYSVVVVAVVAGLSRDGIMWAINESAAAVGTDNSLTFWLPVFLVMFLLFLLSTFYYHVLAQKLVGKLVRKLRLRLTRNLLKAQPNLLQREGHGTLYQIMTQDVTSLSQFSGQVLDTLPSLIFLCIAIPQMFFLSTIAGVFAIFVMLGGCMGYYVQRKAAEAGAENIRLLEIKYFERVSDAISGFRQLRLHKPRRRDLMNDVEEVVEDARTAQLFVATRYSIGEIVVQALKFALFGTVIFLVPHLTDQTATTVFQIITVVLFSLTPFEAIVTKYPAYIHARVCFIRVMELQKKLVEFVDAPQSDSDDALAFDTIELTNVIATHTAREESTFQLGPLDFSINRGETVFIVGENGSGKTTFLSVLTGLLEPVEGDLKINGTPIQIDQMEQYRALFSTVFTDFHLFRKLYGLYDIDEADAEKMLTKVHLADMTRIENNEFTRVDLSAGQKRRLALAVAALENRDIILLDEFVADQDPEHRRYFFEELIPEFKALGKTVIVTTHDLKWIANCDRLLTFEDGQITSIQSFVDGEETTIPLSGATSAD